MFLFRGVTSGRTFIISHIQGCYLEYCEASYVNTLFSLEIDEKNYYYDYIVIFVLEIRDDFSPGRGSMSPENRAIIV